MDQRMIHVLQQYVLPASERFSLLGKGPDGLGPSNSEAWLRAQHPDLHMKLLSGTSAHASRAREGTTYH